MPELFKPAPIANVADDATWHARRRLCIGASEVATLFGCHPYLTPNKLYHIKRGTAADDRRNDKGLRNFGNVMEPIIANLVADKTGWQLENLEEHWIHPDIPEIGATIDRFIVESERGKGILQIKNVSPFSPGWSETRAPDYVEYQVQQELILGAALHGITWACIGALIGGNPDDVRILVRTPDAKVQEKIVKRAQKFWRMVEAGEEPSLTSDDFDHISDMFKQAEPRRGEDNRSMDLETESFVQILEEAKEATKKAKAAEDLAKANLLRAAMIDKGDHMEKDVAMVGEDYTVEFKQIEVAGRTQTVSAHTQLRINIKNNPKELHG